MKVIYKGKKCKVIGMVVQKAELITKPVIVQVAIEWKENGDTFEDWVDANDVEFVND